MFSLNKAALMASLVVALGVGSYVVINKYNNAIELSESLTTANERLKEKLDSLGGELQASELDKLSLLASIKAQEVMFNDHLNNLADVNKQQDVVQTKLKEVFIHEQINKDWGNTALPDDVKRVLYDATRTQSNNNNKASAGAATGLPP